MTEKVEAFEIEQIVGVRRQLNEHIGRVTLCCKKVYILHSQVCLDLHPDLRECPFSLALDDGISWGLEHTNNRPVRLAVVAPGLTIGCWCGMPVGEGGCVGNSTHDWNNLGRA